MSIAVSLARRGVGPEVRLSRQVRNKIVLVLVMFAVSIPVIALPKGTVTRQACKKVVRIEPAGVVRIMFNTVDDSTFSIPMGMGGPREADHQCRMAGVDLRFHWRGKVDGVLLPGVPPYRVEGGDGPQDLMVDYWGYFVPKQKAHATIGPNAWKYRLVLNLAEHPNVIVYPVADWPSERHALASLDDPNAWRPTFQFRGLQDGKGLPVFFTCSGVRLRRISASIVRFSVPLPPETTCIAYFSASPTSGGRIRVRDPDFFVRGDAIIRSVINSINSFRH